MDAETTFHTLFVVFFVLTFALRVYYHARAGSFRRQGTFTDEGRAFRLARVVWAPPYLVLLVVYLVRPSTLAGAALPFPEWLRWTGLAAACLGLAALVWIQRELGKNFSTVLRIREGHTLVTTGPYRWVRHPMYTTFIVLFTGLFLLTANAVVIPSGMAMLFLAMAWRTPREEAMLLAAFGDEYRAYQSRTGAYLPRWHLAGHFGTK